MDGELGCVDGESIVPPGVAGACVAEGFAGSLGVVEV
jgi:hypothetical protein